MDLRSDRQFTFRAFAASLAVAASALALHGSPARSDDRARGEIRLVSPLSSVPSSSAVSADGRFVLVSTADGNVSTFDVNSRYNQNEVLMSAPIRDEELQKQRPIAISPSGDLIAMGAPREYNKPDSARVYFFRRSENKRILFTIDGLPSRPLELGFTADRGGKRLMLVALLADKQLPRVFDVTRIRDAGRDPLINPTYSEVILPEPVAGFASDCKRSECHSFGLSFPPNPDSEIRLVVGSDSGVIFYDRNFEVASYGFWKDGRPDLRRVSSVSFSPDGKRVAIGRRALNRSENDENESCSVHVYDVDAIRKVGADRKLTAKPLFKLQPPKHEGLEVCYFSYVVWTRDAIFASGNFVAAPPAGQPCKTFRDLEPGYDPYANMLVRWSAAENATPTLHCLGTNTAMDLRPFPTGGVVAITQDPSLIVFDPNGEVSRYPAQRNQPRLFEGPVLDFRDASRGELSANTDGSIVYLRPLAVPRPYIAFDLTPPQYEESLVSVVNDDVDAGRAELFKKLADNRSEPIEFKAKAAGPDRCLGVNFRTDRETVSLEALTVSLRDTLKFRAIEIVRTYQFLEPAKGEDNWRIVLGTTNRLLYASCDQRDLWNGKSVAELDSPGTPIRNDAYQLVVSGDQRFVIVAHADGILRWYRMSTGQNVLSTFLHPDLRSWISWTADGYFDYSLTSGGQVAGWLQSTPAVKGSWLVDRQPLSKYEDWHKPNELRKALSDSQYGREITTAEQSPDTDGPQLQLQIVGGDKIGGPTVQLRIRSSSSDAISMLSPVVIGIEGLGRIDLKAPLRWRQQGESMLAEGSFQLPPCLQRPGKTRELWVLFEGSRDHKFFTYAGADSKVDDCGQKKVWGIAIGISKYEKDSSSLKYADQDAQRFFDFWKGQGFYGVGRLALLSAPLKAPAKMDVIEGGKSLQSKPMSDTNYKTVREFVRGELKAIKDAIKPGDMLLVYFAGHGFSLKNEDFDHWYFMPSDGDINKLGETAFSIPQLATALDINEIDRTIPILVFIDACRNSRIFPDRIQGASGEKVKSDFRKLAKYDATMFLATGSGEAAYELPAKDLKTPTNVATCESSVAEDEGGGAFTHVLLEILNGRKGMDEQGRIPLHNIEKHLSEDVPKICLRQRSRRYPLETSLRGLFWKD